MRHEEKEDSILLAAAEDKFRQCSQQYMLTNTGFLDLRQRSLVEARCRQLERSAPEVRCVFFRRV